MNKTEESGAGKGAYTVYSISMQITLHNSLTQSSHYYLLAMMLTFGFPRNGY